MKRVLLILSKGFEELEAVAPLDLLRRAGIEAVSASAGPDLWVQGGRGVAIRADRMLDDCLENNRLENNRLENNYLENNSLKETFDMIILPGGPGVDAMRKDARIVGLVKRAHGQGIPLAAICAAPVILADAGVAAQHILTSFPARREELEPKAKAYSVARVVEDGKVITSRGAGTAEEFALHLIAYLLGPAAAEDVRAKIVARHFDPAAGRLAER